MLVEEESSVIIARLYKQDGYGLSGQMNPSESGYGHPTFY